MTDTALAAELLGLERALAERDPTGIGGGLMTLVADDFLEIGRSGRIWTRASIRGLLEGPRSGPVPIRAFAIARLAEGVVLTTYRTPDAMRSSIWVRRGRRWQIRFHQATPPAT